jgi:hypothetical protein
MDKDVIGKGYISIKCGLFCVVELIASIAAIAAISLSFAAFTKIPAWASVFFYDTNCLRQQGG